jgi:hypothetical protein
LLVAASLGAMTDIHARDSQKPTIILPLDIVSGRKKHSCSSELEINVLDEFDPQNPGDASGGQQPFGTGRSLTGSD